MSPPEEITILIKAWPPPQYANSLTLSLAKLALSSCLQSPPLYLHITSTSKDGLEKAVEKVNDLMKQELPNLVDERRFRRREPDQVERDEFGRRKWPEEKIPVDLEPIPGFNLRAQVVGHGGAYVKHIQQETRCRVQIKGRNSGFTEHGTNRESDEPMYLHVAYVTHLFFLPADERYSYPFTDDNQRTRPERSSTRSRALPLPSRKC